MHVLQQDIVTYDLCFFEPIRQIKAEPKNKQWNIMKYLKISQLPADNMLSASSAPGKYVNISHAIPIQSFHLPSTMQVILLKKCTSRTSLVHLRQFALRHIETSWFNQTTTCRWVLSAVPPLFEITSEYCGNGVRSRPVLHLLTATPRFGWNKSCSSIAAPRVLHFLNARVSHSARAGSIVKSLRGSARKKQPVIRAECQHNACGFNMRHPKNTLRRRA